jgi:hypothetical protein
MLYPTNIKKYSGTISTTNKKIIIKYKTKGRIFTIKEFIFADFNNKEEAMEKAVEHKKKWSIVNNLVKNKYEIIEENNNKYIKIYTKNNKCFYIDYDDKNYIETHNWNLSTSNKYAMSLDDDTKKKMTFHEIKYGHRNIIHLNNNTLDNRIDNIEILKKKDIIEDTISNNVISI